MKHVDKHAAPLQLELPNMFYSCSLSSGHRKYRFFKVYNLIIQYHQYHYIILYNTLNLKDFICRSHVNHSGFRSFTLCDI